METYNHIFMISVDCSYYVNLLTRKAYLSVYQKIYKLINLYKCSLDRQAIVIWYHCVIKIFDLKWLEWIFRMNLTKFALSKFELIKKPIHCFVNFYKNRTNFWSEFKSLSEFVKQNYGVKLKDCANLWRIFREYM